MQTVTTVEPASLPRGKPGDSLGHGGPGEVRNIYLWTSECPRGWADTADFWITARKMDGKTLFSFSGTTRQTRGWSGVWVTMTKPSLQAGRSRGAVGQWGPRPYVGGSTAPSLWGTPVSLWVVSVASQGRQRLPHLAFGVRWQLSSLLAGRGLSLVWGLALEWEKIITETKCFGFQSPFARRGISFFNSFPPKIIRKILYLCRESKCPYVTQCRVLIISQEKWKNKRTMLIKKKKYP